MADEKSIEQLLEEQNQLIHELLQRPTESQEQRFARMAHEWDAKKGVVGRFLWQNPYRR